MNSFIIGFSQECSFPEIIEKLARINIIKISEWVTTQNRGTIDLFDFYFGRTFNQRPIKNKTPNAIYDAVSEYMLEFCNINSRNNLSHKYINATPSTVLDDMHEFKKFVYLIYDIFIEKKVELVIFQEIPHDGAEAVLYRMAQVMKINTIVLANFTHFWGRTFLFYSLDDFGDFKYTPILSENINETKLDYHEFKSKMFYMKAPGGYLDKISLLNKLTKKLGKKLFLKTFLTSFLSKKKLTALKYKFATSIIQQRSSLEYKDNIENLLEKNVDLTTNYVYFALHLDPEVPTVPLLAGIYSDQVLAIERLSAILPKDMWIYVKDNPKQTDIFRPKAFFDRLHKLQNVKLVNENTYDLINNSRFVATVAGTAGWEAITGGKNVLMFGKSWYQNFPGAFKFNDKTNIDEILNYKIDKSKIDKPLRELFAKSCEGMIYFAFDIPKYSITETYPEYNRENNINFLCEAMTKMIRNIIDSK